MGVVLHFAVLPDLRLPARRESLEIKLLGDVGIGILVDDHEVEVPVCFQDGVNGQFAIVAGGRDGLAAALNHFGRELEAEVIGVRDIRTGGGRTVDVRGAQDSLVSPLAPAVQGRRVVSVGGPPVTQVPEQSAGVSAVEQAADGVGNEQAIDQAGHLLARGAIVGVVFRGHDVDARGLGAHGRWRVVS